VPAVGDLLNFGLHVQFFAMSTTVAQPFMPQNKSHPNSLRVAYELRHAKHWIYVALLRIYDLKRF
jgi:hypothetical protein